MGVLRQGMRLQFLLLAAMLALLLFISSFWLPQGGACGGVWQPCFHHPTVPTQTQLYPGQPDGGPALLRHCPGQRFQAWRLLQELESSLADEDDVLLEPYLQSWDQLLNFMESLGTVASFFSQKVKEKLVLMRELSLRRSREADGKHAAPDGDGLENGAFRSVRSMVEAELKAGAVDFTRRTDSGCRTLLRLHRSLLWLKLMLEGLADPGGQDRTPGELSRDAYKVALAPHHPWLLRQAAELVFLALPDRHYFLQLVCVQSQQEATPILHVIIHTLTLVHTQTQQILSEYDMLELP